MAKKIKIYNGSEWVELLKTSDIASWAKASSKPTYTASEVGALSSATKYAGSASIGGAANSANKIEKRFTKTSEASTATGYYKIATITHSNWSYCSFTMLCNNSYSGTLFNTLFDVRCGDNATTLTNFAFHIIGGDDISSKLAYLETKSGDNITKIEIFMRCGRYEHPNFYLIALSESSILSLNSTDWGDTPDKADSTTMTGNATNVIVASNSLKLNSQEASYYLNYNNLTNKPTIPTVSNGTITIKQTGISDQTFTLNGSATTITLADTNTHNSHKIISGVNSSSANITSASASSGDITLGDSGVTAGTYKRVTVNAKGIVIGGDNTDANDNTWRKVQLNGTDKLGTGTSTNPLNIKAGSNMTITESSGTFTFAATDTTYESKAAASGGTAVSLVTTGEKYSWNNKSSLAIGTTSTTAAAGNHTHATTLAADSGTSTVNLAANTTYKLTAGGNSVIFKTPASGSSEQTSIPFIPSIYSKTLKQIYDASVKCNQGAGVALGWCFGDIYDEGTNYFIEIEQVNSTDYEIRAINMHNPTTREEGSGPTTTTITSAMGTSEYLGGSILYRHKIPLTGTVNSLNLSGYYLYIINSQSSKIGSLSSTTTTSYNFINAYVSNGSATLGFKTFYYPGSATMIFQNYQNYSYNITNTNIKSGETVTQI